MNDDDRLLLDVRSWLKDEYVVLPDAEQAGRLVAAGLPQTRQLRRRRWPLPPLRRQTTPVSPAAIPETEFQPTPIPATNGRSPTVLGRTQSMLSPVKAITAGALVFALGGVLLITQPFEHAGSVPGAATDAERATAFFTGRVVATESCADDRDPVVEDIDGVLKMRGAVFGCLTWETTDPRMNGESTVVWNNDVHSASGDVPAGNIQSGREALVTETGSWEGTLTHLKVGSGPRLETGWFVGSGDHEGLMAYVTSQDDGRSLWGYISPEPPPVPEVVPEQ